MRLLARLHRRQAGPTLSRIESGRLARFIPGHVLDAESLAAQHNEAERVIRSLQARVAELEGSLRDIVGRVDMVEGKPNSTNGTPIELRKATSA